MPLDLGTDGNFIDAEFTSQLHLLSIPLQESLESLAITRAPLIRITHVTPSLSLLLSDNHQEENILYVIDSSPAPVVLGHQEDVRLDLCSRSCLPGHQGTIHLCSRSHTA